MFSFWKYNQLFYGLKGLFVKILKQHEVEAISGASQLKVLAGGTLGCTLGYLSGIFLGGPFNWFPSSIIGGTVGAYLGMDPEEESENFRLIPFI